MSTRSRHSFLLNFLGFLAYLSCLFQWVFVVVPFLPGMFDSDVFRTFVPSGAPEMRVNAPAPQAMSEWLALTVTVVTALVVVAATVFALARLPRAVGRTGQKLTHSVAARAMPVITHHAKIPEKKRRALTARLVFDIKLAILVLPLIVLLVVPLPEMVVSPQVLVLVAALAAGWSLFLFCLQVILARAFKVSLDRLW